MCWWVRQHPVCDYGCGLHGNLVAYCQIIQSLSGSLNRPEALFKKVNTYLQKESMLCFKIPKVWFVIHYKVSSKILQNLLFANIHQWQLHMLGHMTQIVQQLAWRIELNRIFSWSGMYSKWKDFWVAFLWIFVTCLKLVYVPCKIKESTEFWCRWGRIRKIIPHLGFIHPEGILITCHQSLVVNLKLQFFHVILRKF